MALCVTKSSVRRLGLAGGNAFPTFTQGLEQQRGARAFACHPHLSRILIVLALAAGSGCAGDEAYVAEIQKWRQENDDFLRSERSPLRLVGRFQISVSRLPRKYPPPSTANR